MIGLSSGDTPILEQNLSSHASLVSLWTGDVANVIGAAASVLAIAFLSATDKKGQRASWPLCCSWPCAAMRVPGSDDDLRREKSPAAFAAFAACVVSGFACAAVEGAAACAAAAFAIAAFCAATYDPSAEGNGTKEETPTTHTWKNISARPTMRWRHERTWARKLSWLAD